MTRIADHVHAFDADDDRLIVTTTPGVIGVELDDKTIVRVITDRTQREDTTYGTLPTHLAWGPWPHITDAVEHVRDDDTREQYVPLSSAVAPTHFRRQIHQTYSSKPWVERAHHIARTTDAEPNEAIIMVLSDRIDASGIDQVPALIDYTGWDEFEVQSLVNDLLLGRQQEIRRQLNEQ